MVKPMNPICAAAVLFGGLVITTPAMSQTRGELLYTTHCVSCHTTQVHWRDSRSANNWSSLMYQVRRWQGVASLGWTDTDILEVAHYLNDSIYRFEPTTDPVTSMNLHGAEQRRTTAAAQPSTGSLE